MKAYAIRRYSPFAPLELMELERPKAGPEDVLIEIHAASVNPVDFKIRNGGLKRVLKLEMPLVLGNDLAGVVVEAGERVSRFKAGDEVYARTDKGRIGTFAAYAAVAASAVALKPKSLSRVEAASIPLVGLTAWQALVECGRVGPGQRVLIHAGSGGVGAFAVQLAKHLGATVAATTGTANVEWVRGLGADVVVDYRKERFEDALRGYDFVLDTLGGEALERSFRVLRRGGQLVSVSGVPTPEFGREIGAPGWLRAAFWWISRKVRDQARAAGVGYRFLFMKPSGPQLEEIAALIDGGKIRPAIDRVFAFDEAPSALAYVEKGHSRGKVVIQVRS